MSNTTEAHATLAKIESQSPNQYGELDDWTIINEADLDYLATDLVETGRGEMAIFSDGSMLQHFPGEGWEAITDVAEAIRRAFERAYDAAVDAKASCADGGDVASAVAASVDGATASWSEADGITLEIEIGGKRYRFDGSEMATAAVAGR